MKGMYSITDKQSQTRKKEEKSELLKENFDLIPGLQLQKKKEEEEAAVTLLFG